MVNFVVCQDVGLEFLAKAKPLRPQPKAKASRGAPEFFYRPDPDPCLILTCRIRIQTSTAADNRRKITLSAPLLEKLE